MRRAKRKVREAPPAPAIEKTRGRRFGETLPPIAVEHLVAKLNLSKAALAIGISPGIIHRARKDGFINKPYEVAAWGILQLGQYQPPDSPEVAVVKKLRAALSHPTPQRAPMDDDALINAIAEMLKQRGDV